MLIYSKIRNKVVGVVLATAVLLLLLGAATAPVYAGECVPTTSCSTG